VALMPGKSSQPGLAATNQQDVPVAGGRCSRVPKTAWWLVLLGLLLVAAAVAVGVALGECRKIDLACLPTQPAGGGGSQWHLG
jgi:hypothetical protein